MQVGFSKEDINVFYSTYSLDLLAKLLSPGAEMDVMEPNYHHNPVCPAIAQKGNYSTLLRYGKPRDSELLSNIEIIVETSNQLVSGFKQIFEAALCEKNIEKLAKKHLALYINLSEAYNLIADKKFTTKDGLTGEGLKWKNDQLANIKENARQQLIVGNVMYNPSTSKKFIQNIKDGSLRESYQKKIFN